MTEQVHADSSRIVHPSRPLHRKYIEPIVYLADRMSTADGKVVPKERKLVEELARAARLGDFRHEKWYRDLTDQKACGAIDLEQARQGLLVVLSLLLKADEERRESEHQYFTRIRQMVGGDPIVVPVDLEGHKRLALEYLAQGR